MKKKNVKTFGKKEVISHSTTMTAMTKLSGSIKFEIQKEDDGNFKKESVRIIFRKKTFKKKSSALFPTYFSKHAK